MKIRRWILAGVEIIIAIVFLVIAIAIDVPTDYEIYEEWVDAWSDGEYFDYYDFFHDDAYWSTYDLYMVEGRIDRMASKISKVMLFSTSAVVFSIGISTVIKCDELNCTGEESEKKKKLPGSENTAPQITGDLAASSAAAGDANVNNFSENNKNI